MVAITSDVFPTRAFCARERAMVDVPRALHALVDGAGPAPRDIDGLCGVELSPRAR